VSDRDRVSRAILRKMFYDKRIGARHLGLDDLKKGFPTHEQGSVEGSLVQLIKAGWVLRHPTSYGKQYSLNPKAIPQIIQVLGDS